MSKIKGVLNVADKVLMFWCPGCDDAHAVSDAWLFDGNYDAPTFSPSILVYERQKLINEDLEGDALTAPGNITTAPRCHSFVRAGHIEFLVDSTHEFAGQTRTIPAWPHTEAVTW